MYMVVFSILFFDFIRGLMVRYFNPIWPFWDLEGIFYSLIYPHNIFLRHISSICRIQACWQHSPSYLQPRNFMAGLLLFAWVRNCVSFGIGSGKWISHFESFSPPAFPLIHMVKIVMIFYLRNWSVLTTNLPSKRIFRASRSNSFYLVLLLLMLLVIMFRNEPWYE